MEQENRQHIRYEEIGRVNAPEICALPGILDDISSEGCKIHYTFPVVVDLETEYEIKLSPLHGSNSSPLNNKNEIRYIRNRKCCSNYSN